MADDTAAVVMAADVVDTDFPQPCDSLLFDVIEGLSRSQKVLPPRLLCEERRTRFYERIREFEDDSIALEAELLRKHAADIGIALGPGCAVIEPGFSTAEGTRLLLSQTQRLRAYVPVDRGTVALMQPGAELHRVLPMLRVMPAAADYTRLELLPELDALRARRRLVFFAGGAIGSYESAEAQRLLWNWLSLAGEDGMLVIGVALRQDAHQRQRIASEEEEALMARFHLGLLHRLNREFLADFKPQQFIYRSFYNAKLGRMERHLISLRRQLVQLGGREIVFDAGETLLAHSATRYTADSFSELAQAAGWREPKVWLDEHRRYSLHAFRGPACVVQPLAKAPQADEFLNKASQP